MDSDMGLGTTEKQGKKGCVSNKVQLCGCAVIHNYQYKLEKWTDSIFTNFSKVQSPTPGNV